MKSRIIVAALMPVLFGLAPGDAQEAFPGWSATKRVPTTSNRATYPSIAEEGDTLHVVFRATFTSALGEQGPAEEEILLTQIQTITQLLRTKNPTQVEIAGGEQRLREQKKALYKRLGEVQQKAALKVEEAASPIQTAIFYTRSEDRGRTFWEDPIPVTDKGEIFYGQTAVLVNRDGVHVVYTAEASDNLIHVYHVQSPDGGKTWTRPAEVSSSNNDCFDPYLVPIPGNGLLVCWWEMERTEVEGLRRRDFEMMDELLSKVVVEGRSRETKANSVIRYARMIGGTWQMQKLLEGVRGVIPCVNAATGPNGEVFVYWIDDTGLQMRVSRNGGTSWERTLDFAQVLDPRKNTVFLHDGEDYRFVRGEPERRKAGPLFHRKGSLTGAWNQIVGDQAMHAFPRIDFTKNEIQVIWGITDHLAGDLILYFREDNKPPTSELVFPPDGDFTKHALVFIWRGVDDIATQLTYRKDITERKDPNVRIPPSNWSPYEAEDEYTIHPLDDGYYTIYVQATDFSGNEEVTPSAFDFQTWYVPPAIEADPETVPLIEIETRNVEIKWKTKDNSPSEAALLVAYRLDGNPVTEFAPRESVRVSGLRAGWHQIQLYARDENGNVSPFGETISVSVKLSLQLYWKQIPSQPRQDDVIFVKDDRVDLSWGIKENTNDKGVNYLSSLRTVFETEERQWGTPGYSPDAELSGPENTPLDEGAYIIQILAQDEFGNRVDNYIQCGFTVDHTAPALEFDRPVYNEETGVPTISVRGTDNYSHPQNLVYQFRIKEGDEEGPWSGWSNNVSFECADHPIKWYSWGYSVEVRARDVAGNVTPTPFALSLLWWVRNPWMLYTLIGIGALLILGILFLVVTTFLERARAKKRAAARRKALEEATAAEDLAPAAAAAAESDDLFEVPETAQTRGGDVFVEGEALPSSPGMGKTQPVPPSAFADPFSTGSTADTAVFEDPFAIKEAPSPLEKALEEEPPVIDVFGDEEPPPLEIGGHRPPTAGEPPAETPPPETEPPKKEERSWSPDRDVELDDRDLFDPL